MKLSTFNFQLSTVLALANSADDLTGFIALENEVSIGEDGWALLAPFGEHRKTRSIQKGAQIVQESYVQVVDDAAVDTVLANENGNGFLGKIKRALIKRPIYNGHPDVKLYAPETITLGNEQLIPLGVNEGLRKSARGLEFKPLLVPEGAKAVEGGSKYPSALFLLQKTGRVRENGDIEVRPFKVASIGLTPHPNISGVDSLANAKPNTPAASSGGGSAASQQTKTQNDTIMKQILIGWLAAQGVSLANDSTDQAVFDAFLKENQKHTTSLTALGNEKTTLTQTVTTLTSDRDAHKKRADDATVALTNEQTAFKAERKARCEAVVDLAITQGKLDVAGRESKVNELIALANDKLDAAITALGKLPVKFKVGSDLSDRKGSANNSTAAIALANEIQTLVKAGKSKGQALDEVIKSKPEVYEAYLKEGASITL
jgi:hypothetical protein